MNLTNPTISSHTKQIFHESLPNRNLPDLCRSARLQLTRLFDIFEIKVYIHHKKFIKNKKHYSITVYLLALQFSHIIWFLMSIKRHQPIIHSKQPSSRWWTTQARSWSVRSTSRRTWQRCRWSFRHRGCIARCRRFGGFQQGRRARRSWTLCTPASRCSACRCTCSPPSQRSLGTRLRGGPWQSARRLGPRACMAHKHFLHAQMKEYSENGSGRGLHICQDF